MTVTNERIAGLREAKQLLEELESSAINQRNYTTSVLSANRCQIAVDAYANAERVINLAICRELWKDK